MYSKKQLEGAIGNPTDAASRQAVTDLINLMNSGKKLSLAEERFLGIVLGASVDENGQYLNMHQFKSLENDLFRRLYPSYVRNRDGFLPLNDTHGPVSLGRRMQDTSFLETEYQKWRQIIMSGKHRSSSLQTIANETISHLKEIEEYTKQSQIGGFLKQAMIKEIILHSKYLLYEVDEYYQELRATEQIVDFAKGKVVIDNYVYIHTLFRHYAQHIKVYQLDKSYHIDQQFDYTRLPDILFDIISSFFRNLPDKTIENDRIFVRIRGKLYALWFRKFTRSLKGGAKEVYYRAQTFYHITKQKDLAYASTLKEILSDDGIGLLYK